MMNTGIFRKSRLINIENKNVFTTSQDMDTDDFMNNSTKVQLNIISYATFFNTIFKKVLGDLCIQSLILPNPIFMVYFIYVH